MGGRDGRSSGSSTVRMPSSYVASAASASTSAPSETTRRNGPRLDLELLIDAVVGRRLGLAVAGERRARARGPRAAPGSGRSRPGRRAPPPAADRSRSRRRRRARNHRAAAARARDRARRRTARPSPASCARSSRRGPAPEAIRPDAKAGLVRQPSTVTVRLEGATGARGGCRRPSGARSAGRSRSPGRGRRRARPSRGTRRRARRPRRRPCAPSSWAQSTSALTSARRAGECWMPAVSAVSILATSGAAARGRRASPGRRRGRRARSARRACGARRPSSCSSSRSAQRSGLMISRQIRDGSAPRRPTTGHVVRSELSTSSAARGSRLTNRISPGGSSGRPTSSAAVRAR